MPQVVMSGLVYRRGFWRKQRRTLLVTDSPRLISIDNETDTLKCIIPLSAVNQVCQFVHVCVFYASACVHVMNLCTCVSWMHISAHTCWWCLFADLCAVHRWYWKPGAGSILSPNDALSTLKIAPIMHVVGQVRSCSISTTVWAQMRLNTVLTCAFECADAIDKQLHGSVVL